MVNKKLIIGIGTLILLALVSALWFCNSSNPPKPIEKKLAKQNLCVCVWCVCARGRGRACVRAGGRGGYRDIWPINAPSRQESTASLKLPGQSSLK